MPYIVLIMAALLLPFKLFSKDRNEKTLPLQMSDTLPSPFAFHPEIKVVDTYYKISVIADPSEVQQVRRLISHYIKTNPPVPPYPFAAKVTPADHYELTAKLEAIVAKDPNSVTDDMLKAVIKSTADFYYQTINDRDFHGLQTDNINISMAKMLIKTGRSSWFDTLSIFSTDQSFQKAMLTAYKYATIPYEEAVADLQAAGVWSAKTNVDSVRQLWETSEHPKHFVYNYLIQQKRVVEELDQRNFDYPDPNYRALLLEFMKQSHGTLAHLSVWSINKGDVGTKRMHAVIVAGKEKAYLVFPSTNFKEEYDLNSIKALLDLILTDMGSINRFNQVFVRGYSYIYVWGDPEKIKPLMNKYLPYKFK